MKKTVLIREIMKLLESADERVLVFVLAYLLLHRVFFLIPLGGNQLIAVAALSALGCLIALTTKFLMKQKE